MLKLLALDRFTILLFVMVLLASLWPISGQAAEYFSVLTTSAIALLFFLHGAKLSRDAIREGLFHWKLHSIIFLFTFALFPGLGLLARPILEPLLGQMLYWGFLFLCFLPSTVQSSIAFTSMAQGNVAGAVCSASFSNIIGMLITPLLVSLFIMGSNTPQYDPSQAILQIIGLLLVPFVLGQLMRPWIYPKMQKFPNLVKNFDQWSILLVVYGAFSGAVVNGLWQQVDLSTLFLLILVCSVLLALIMGLAFWCARLLGFDLADQKTIFFCASKKTLASGVPMAQILFMGLPLGILLLPIMIFHQIQLMVCGILANAWSKSSDSSIE